VSVIDGRPLSNTVGAVLDPIFSLRTRVRVEAGATVHVCFSTLVANSREQIVGLADKYQDPITFQRIATMAWTHAQVQLYHMGINADEANLFQHLADGLIYSDATLRPTSDVLRRGKGSARDLWRHGISGDRPILLLRIDDVDEREIRAPAPACARLLPQQALRRRPRASEREGDVLCAGSADIP
jgi:cyclic beta-1,2-glucan synthetase